MGIHVGIVMDGNGRWATEQNLPRSAGHARAMEVAVELVKACPDIGVDTLSLYAFAINNWKREKTEVDFLWKLFKSFLGKRIQELINEGARFQLLGNRDGIPSGTLQLIEKAERDSAKNSKLLIQIGLNYDGIDEIVRAVKDVAKEVKNGILEPKEITQSHIEKYLDTHGAPNPDIIIRTGVDQNVGETDTHLWRGSSFLQFQSAQAYGIALTTRFPDMTIENIKEAIRVVDLESRLFGSQRK